MRVVRSLLILLAVALFAPATWAATPDGYTYYSVGDVEARTSGKTSFGMMLMGGGDWPTEAWRWFLAKAGNGHIVIISASADGESGKELFNDIGGVASVQTITFDDRKAANDPRVLAILRRADGIFIGGGDQSNYVRYWKDSPVDQVLNEHVRKGRPIGGTSAGLAILGIQGYGAMDGGSVDSIAALADPLGPAVTMVGDFLAMPMMEHVVTDTHFNARDRLGRLIAFLAQVRAGGNQRAIGIGVDEASALCVESDGTAKLHTERDGYAWLVEPQGQPGAVKGKPLDWPAVKITGIGPDGALNLKTLKVTKPAFAATATVKQGRVSGAPFPPNSPWSLAIHGGAGVIARGDLTPEQERAYRAGLDEALAAGAEVLRAGGASLDAVEATVRVLEDNPLFNAGRGAVFDAEGKNQLDASIMDGAQLKAGAVAGVSATKNPVTLARTVMERSRHVLLTGAGADQFAREQGVEQVDPSYFRTEKRWNDYLEWKAGNQAALDAGSDQTHRFGTVGAVAMDVRGHLAAATSTGGLTGKRWGRIGDSPIIGAGTYAADGTCAVSATGTGEFFIRFTAARQVCDRIAWNEQTVQSAVQDTIDELGEIGGDGGLIALDGDGRPAFAMTNTEGMYRGLVSNGAPARTAIYADEDLVEPR